MALLDLLGRRWALRTIWELRDGPLLFRSLQERCGGMSSSVLNQRLGELRAAGIIEGGGDPTTIELPAVAAPVAAGHEATVAQRRRRIRALPTA